METRKTGDFFTQEHCHYNQHGLTINNEDEDDDEDMRHLLDDQSPDQENREEHSGRSQLVVILPCLVMMTEGEAGWHITSRSLMSGIIHSEFVPDETTVKYN